MNVPRSAVNWSISGSSAAGMTGQVTLTRQVTMRDERAELLGVSAD
jgi:hypothetical protein